MSKLFDFHLSLREEYKMILKKFNILFYGYGCKQELIKELFPSCYIFNFKFQKVQNIIEELQIEGFTTQNTIQDIDKEIGKKNKTLTLCVVNFNFTVHELCGLKNIQVIGTMESMDINISAFDIKRYNFILRDLTTYELYTEETMDIDLYSNKVTNTLMVYDSVPQKSQIVFANLLKQDDCMLNVLYERVKKPLMLSKKTVILDLLNEFIDHTIIKVMDGASFILNLSKSDKKELLTQERIKSVIYKLEKA